MYVDEILSYYIERDIEQKEVHNFLQNKITDLVFIRAHVNDDQVENRYLLIQGEEGSGKKSLLAYMARNLSMVKINKLTYS